MGGALLSTPWRKLPVNNTADLDFVKSYRPANTEVQHLRILVNGPAGAGKSSFINSVESVLLNRVTSRALTDAISDTSFTGRYKTYKIHKDRETFYSFIFNDIMGLESEGGVCKEDVELALKGHVTDNYKFQPTKPLTEDDPEYKSCPTLEDRVHVLVCVFPVSSVTLMNEGVVKKLRELRLAASDLEIPQLAILTKPDVICDKTREDIRNVYKSKYLKSQVDQFQLLLGIPHNRIFLVKNYITEMETEANVDAVILYALKKIIQDGEDFLYNM